MCQGVWSPPWPFLRMLADCLSPPSMRFSERFCIRVRGPARSVAGGPSFESGPGQRGADPTGRASPSTRRIWSWFGPSISTRSPRDLLVGIWEAAPSLNSCMFAHICFGQHEVHGGSHFGSCSFPGGSRDCLVSPRLGSECARWAA